MDKHSSFTEQCPFGRAESEISKIYHLDCCSLDSGSLRTIMVDLGEKEVVHVYLPSTIEKTDLKAVQAVELEILQLES
jgi:hypothetical protein